MPAGPGASPGGGSSSAARALRLLALLALLAHEGRPLTLAELAAGAMV
jgi:hypothetical protein